MKKSHVLSLLLAAALLICAIAVCAAPRAKAEETPHVHCVCGGKLEGAALASHNANDGACAEVEWTAWSDPTRLPTVEEFGNYYLTVDVVLTSVWYPTGTSGSATLLQMNLCLNGHTITGPTNARLAQIKNTTLNICDCSEAQSGALQGRFQENFGTTGGAGRLMQMQNNTNAGVPTTVNLYGGSYQYVGEKVTPDTLVGSIFVVGNSTTCACSLNMYGGTIQGGYGKGLGAVQLNNNGQFHMYGGTVANCEAALGAVGTTTNTAQKLSLSGNVQFKNNGGKDVYINKGTLTVEGLDTDSRIGISAAAPDTFSAAITGDNIEKQAASFFSANSAYAVVLDDNTRKISLSAVDGNHIHCVCGGKCAGVGDHTCVNRVWTEWTDAATLPAIADAGNYCLATNVELTSAWYPCSSSKTTKVMNLCLNGHTIKSASDYRVVNVKNMTLNICDCSEEQTGKLQSQFDTTSADGKSKPGAGRLAILYNNTTGGAPTILNIYGGTYEYIGTVDETLTGSVFSVGNATASACSLNMYGGTIQGGFGKGAGAVQTNNNGQFHMYGGTVANCEAALGAVITTTNSKQKMSLSGNVQFRDNGGKDVYINKGTFTVDGLDTDSRIGLAAAAPDTFSVAITGENVEKKASIFFSADAAYAVVLDDDTSKISLLAVEGNHIHCICGGNCAGVNGHICVNRAWTEWTDEAALPTAAGHYFLAKDVQLAAAWRQDKTGFDLCLNGHTVRSAEDARALILNGAAMNISDCSAEQTGKIQSQNTTSQAGRLIYLYNNKTSTVPTTLNVFGGTFEFVGAVDDAQNGNLICVGQVGTQVKISSELNMYGGTIQGGFGVGTGAVLMNERAAFNMYGGTITGSTAAEGAVKTTYDDSAFTMTGGTITGCSGACGAVFVANGTFTMTGGTIEGGAVTDSKGISLLLGNLILKGSPVIDCGDSDIYVDNSTAIAYRNQNIDITELDAPADPISVDLKINGAFAKVTSDQVNWFVTAKPADEDVVIENSYVNGYLYLTRAGSAEIRNAKGETVGSYYSVAEAVKHLAADQYVFQKYETHERVVYEGGGELYLDINGKNIRGSYDLNGAVLCGMNSATNGYENNANLFYADVENGTVATAVKAPNKMRYLATRSDLFGGGSKYSFDRFYVGITAITLNPVSGEVGYKAIVGGNENVKAALAAENAFGFNVQLEGYEPISVSLGSDAFVTGSTGNKQTLTIAGQLAAVNADPSLESLSVTANAFITLADGTVITSADYSYTLPQMFKLFDNNFAEQTVTTKNSLSALYKKYSIMTGWDLANIAAYGA